jgi:MoxR-like ATPase
VCWAPHPLRNLDIYPDDAAVLTRLVAGTARDEEAISDRATILLHGPSGTGKTFLAERIAELAQRPLLRVPCEGVAPNVEGVRKVLDPVHRRQNDS